jgi:hypothetical protein
MGLHTKLTKSIQLVLAMKLVTAFIISISFGVISNNAFANQQTEEVEPELDLESLKVKNIEVITITGRKSIGAYRRALLKAEKDLYKQYNKFADADEFKVICKSKQTQLDSRKKTQICTPRYEKTLATQETQFQVSRVGTSLSNNQNLNSGLNTAGGATIEATEVNVPDTLGSLLNLQNISRGQVGGKLRQKREAHYLDMLEQLKQHPELGEKLVEYVIAKQKYQLRFKQK